MPQWHGIVAKGQLLIAKFPKCAKSTGIKVSGENTQKVNQFYIFARHTTILWEAFKRNLQKKKFGPASGTPKTKEVVFIFIFYLLLEKGYNLVAPLLVACPTANAALPLGAKKIKSTLMND